MFLFIHRPFEIWPALGDMHVERVYALLAILVWAVWPNKRLVPTRYDVGIALFCLAIVASWTTSPWSAGCEHTIEDYFKIVVFYVLVSTAVTRIDQLKKVSLGFLAIMAVYLLHSLWEFRNGRYTYRMGIPRMIGVDTSLGDPNSFGASIVFALPFVRLFWLTNKDRLVKLFLFGYTGLSALCILLTGSRSSLVGLLVCALIFILQSQKRFRYLIVGGVLACGAFVALPGDLQTRFETIINPEVRTKSDTVSAYGRLEGLERGWELFQKYPLTGCGPGVWRKATGAEVESHNLYGQTMGELGILGVITFGGLVVMFALGLRALRKRAQNDSSPDGEFAFHLTTTLATALFLMLLEGMFGHNLFRFSWLWYIGFLLIATRALGQPQPQAWALPQPAMRLVTR
jgi:O-antigen ligase